MSFWTLAFKMRWVTSDALRIAVKTTANPYGEITAEEYEEITGVVFE